MNAFFSTAELAFRVPRLSLSRISCGWDSTLTPLSCIHLRLTPTRLLSQKFCSRSLRFLEKSLFRSTIRLTPHCGENSRGLPNTLRKTRNARKSPFRAFSLLERFVRRHFEVIQ